MTPEPDERHSLEFQPQVAPVVTAEMVPRHVSYHAISAEELDMVGSIGNSIHLTFFGVTIGLFAAFWIMLKQVGAVAEGDKALVIGLMATSGVLSLYFLAQSLWGLWQA